MMAEAIYKPMASGDTDDRHALDPTCRYHTNNEIKFTPIISINTNDNVEAIAINNETRGSHFRSLRANPEAPSLPSSTSRHRW